MLTLEVDVATQKMLVRDNDRIIKEYIIATAKNGVGEIYGSQQTPRGLHMVRAKIGANYPANTVFVSRRPTGEIYQSELKEKFPDRDWILTRIFWLSGLEVGKNRLGNVDSMRRCIYIHGVPDEAKLGTPRSKGCINMSNQDIIELFDLIPVKTPVIIIG
jgi:L,D-transpeptidase YbiS